MGARGVLGGCEKGKGTGGKGGAKGDAKAGEKKSKGVTKKK